VPSYFQYASSTIGNKKNTLITQTCSLCCLLKENSGKTYHYMEPDYTYIYMEMGLLISWCTAEDGHFNLRASFASAVVCKNNQLLFRPTTQH
jgi:hypothetical protein